MVMMMMMTIKKKMMMIEVFIITVAIKLTSYIPDIIYLSY